VNGPVVAVLQVAQHVRVHLPEVAGDADARAVAGLDDEAGRIGGIVDGSLGMHGQLADRERRVVREDHRRCLPAIDGAGVERPLREVDGNAPLARDARRPADVIVVLVREDDPADLLDAAPHLLEPLSRLPRPEAGVDEDRGAVALEVEGVTRTAGTERRDDHDLQNSREPSTGS